MAARASPTARTWAWYHVVPIWAAYHKTVPKPRKTVVATRTQVRIGSLPSIHQAIPTSRAPRIAKISWPLVARPHSHTKGMSTTAGNGGNGTNPRGIPSAPVGTGRTSWKKALPGEVGVASTGKRIAAWPSRNARACHSKWL